ncbi:MAG: hypothetical protein IJS90_04880 [Clostridia bacterium]|nr:hypothetical protein [Clostridia bacterium]
MIHCPGCGSGLRFDIETQQMKCDYCDSLYDPYRFDSEKDDAKKAESFDTYVWVCPSCGAELETPDEMDAMGFCPYCGGASLLFDKIRKQWRPESVIPFSVTKEQCKEAYLKEARKHPFVSKQYKDPKLLETFRGIYMPYWSYRLLHRGKYEIIGESGESRDGDYMVSEVYKITGDIDMEYDGYAHDASSAFDDRLSEDLAPFESEGKKPFTPGFLSGFYTVIGDKPREEFDERTLQYAKEKAVMSIAERSTEVGELLRKKSLRVKPGESTVPTEILDAQRALYPVWFMSYRKGDRVTYAAVNGQTGKVSADLPASPGKLLILAGALAALIFAFLMMLPSVKASVASLITAIIFLAGNIFLNVSFNRLVGQSKELRISPEAVAYKKHNVLRIVVSAVCVFIGFIMTAAEPAHNVVPYTFCILMAALFIFFIVKFIRFQLSVAKRRPPQMDRKGAASDEK